MTVYCPFCKHGTGIVMYDVESNSNFTCSGCKKRLEIIIRERQEEQVLDEFGMDSNAKCLKCGGKLQIVRPGKYSCGVCE